MLKSRAILEHVSRSYFQDIRDFGKPQENVFRISEYLFRCRAYGFSALLLLSVSVHAFGATTVRIKSGGIVTSTAPWIAVSYPWYPNPKDCVSAAISAPSDDLGSAVILSGEFITTVIPDVCAWSDVTPRAQLPSLDAIGIGCSTGQSARLSASESQNDSESQSVHATTKWISIFAGGAADKTAANDITSIDLERAFFLKAMISDCWASMVDSCLWLMASSYVNSTTVNPPSQRTPPITSAIATLALQDFGGQDSTIIPKATAADPAMQRTISQRWVGPGAVSPDSTDWIKLQKLALSLIFTPLVVLALLSAHEVFKRFKK
jgi:hypothetical protein